MLAPPTATKESITQVMRDVRSDLDPLCCGWIDYDKFKRWQGNNMIYSWIDIFKATARAMYTHSPLRNTAQCVAADVDAEKRKYPWVGLDIDCILRGYKTYNSAQLNKRGLDVFAFQRFLNNLGLDGFVVGRPLFEAFDVDRMKKLSLKQVASQLILLSAGLSPPEKVQYAMGVVGDRSDGGAREELLAFLLSLALPGVPRKRVVKMCDEAAEFGNILLWPNIQV